MGCNNSKQGTSDPKKVEEAHKVPQQQQQQTESQTAQGQQGQQQQKQSTTPAEYLQQGKDKLNQMKDEYERNREKKWLEEVIVAETDLFIEVNQWFDLYEKKAVQSDKKGKDSGPFSPEKMLKKIAENMKVSLSETIMKVMVENIAKGIEYGAVAVKSVEPKIYSFLNSIVSTLLTYRFQKKDKEKFQYLRGITVDRMAFTFIDLLDHEAKKLDKFSEGAIIEESTVTQIIDNQVEIIHQKIDEQKDKLKQQLKENTLIQASGKDKDIEEGMQIMIETIQSYGEQKLEQLISTIKVHLPVLLNIIAQEQQKIRTQFAIEAQRQGFQEPEEEYINNTRQKFLEKVEGYYALTETYVSKFVNGFVDMVVKMAEIEEQDPEEQQ